VAASRIGHTAAGVQEASDVFGRKTQQVQPVPHADLIDLLLDSDEPTRKLLLFEALQTGAIVKSEAVEVLAMVARLERAAGPRSDETARPSAEPSAAEAA
jgi:hypothetical protein